MIVNRVLDNLKNRRNRVLNGKFNCIESPFKRFQQNGNFIGIEQGKYYLLIGETKSAKTMLANYIALYNTLDKAYFNPNIMRAKIFYFALEETPEVIIEKYMCYLLYTLTKGKITVSPQDLKSVDSNNPVDEHIIKMLESDEFMQRLKFFEKTVTFSTTSNPTGINKEVRAFVDNNGTMHYKKQKIKDGITNKTRVVDAFDYYVPNDPDLYVICIVDTINLISTENGKSLRESINKLSSDYIIKTRNNFNVTWFVIQQCNSDTQTTDSFKLGRLAPTLNSPGDSKYTTKDANTTFALFSPVRYGLKDYKKYDITKFKDNIRFLEVLSNREGSCNCILPLFFYGPCNYFRELPLPEDLTGINRAYKQLNSIRNKKVTSTIKASFYTIISLNCNKKIKNISYLYKVFVPLYSKFKKYINIWQK